MVNTNMHAHTYTHTHTMHAMNILSPTNIHTSNKAIVVSVTLESGANIDSLQTNFLQWLEKVLWCNVVQFTDYYVILPDMFHLRQPLHPRDLVSRFGQFAVLYSNISLMPLNELHRSVVQTLLFIQLVVFTECQSALQTCLCHSWVIFGLKSQSKCGSLVPLSEPLVCSNALVSYHSVVSLEQNDPRT